jgi:hypothetical protein
MLAATNIGVFIEFLLLSVFFCLFRQRRRLGDCTVGGMDLLVVVPDGLPVGFYRVCAALADCLWGFVAVSREAKLVGGFLYVMCLMLLKRYVFLLSCCDFSHTVLLVLSPMRSCLMMNLYCLTVD